MSHLVSNFSPSKIFTPLLWGFALVMGVRFMAFIQDVTPLGTHSFGNYYTAARLYADGESIAQFYDDEWYGERVAGYTEGVSDIYMPHFPTATVVFSPLALWDYHTARSLWMGLNVIVLVVTLGWLMSHLKFESWLIPLTIICVLSYEPLYRNFYVGQVYVLLFGLATVAWYLFHTNRDRLLGGLLAFLILFKTAGWLLIPLFVIKRRWQAILWCGGIGVLLVLVTLPLVGMDSWQTWLSVSPSYSARPSFTVTAYQTVFGYFKHLFLFDVEWNRHPLLDSSFLATMMPLLAQVVIVGVSLYRARMVQSSALLFSGFLLANIVISPTSLVYHYSLLLLPIVLLIGEARNWTWRRRLVLIIGLVLMSVQYNFQSQQLTRGILAVFAYAKLYGALILWGLALFPPKDGTKDIANQTRLDHNETRLN